MKNLILVFGAFFLFSLSTTATKSDVKAEEVVEANNTKWCWATHSTSNGISICNGSANDCTKPCVGKTVPIIN